MRATGKPAGAICAKRRPVALDLFCGAGGAAVGLHRAGFDVIGVDINPQPRYPFTFIQGDALDPPIDPASVAFVWASPVCKRWTRHSLQRGNNDTHPDQITPVRELLRDASQRNKSLLHCIENVPHAPLRWDLVLTGEMFGAATYRQRIFEVNFLVLAPDPGQPFGPATRPGSVTVAGHSGGGSKRDGWTNGHKADWERAMGIDWMTNKELVQAVPPAYSEFIGRAALRGT